MAWLLVVLLVADLDPALTPGMVRYLSKSQVCETKWGLDQRHVTTAMRKHVLLAYGVAWSDRGQYEVDHLIPRELGGADDVRNLWPQPWPEARQKDRLENKLHVLVCAGQLSLQDAQDAIRTDWRAAYTKWVQR